MKAAISKHAVAIVKFPDLFIYAKPVCHFYSVTVVNFYSLKATAIVENDC